MLGGRLRQIVGRSLAAPKSKHYDPGLDGLRTVAVLLVLVFHTLPNWTPGGFVGVDLFFVLSGYLITTILVREHDAWGSINLRNFYIRRLIRLTPPLLLVVAAYAGAMLLLSKSPLPHLEASLYAATYTMNLAKILGWSTGAGLAHTWSLAVEEQFYLLWPAALILLVAARKRATLGYLCLGVVVLVALWRSYLASTSEGEEALYRTYTGLDTRLDALLIGAALALGALPRKAAAVLRRLWFVPVLALAGFAVSTHWTAPWLHYWGFTAVALAAAWLLVAISGSADNPLRRALGGPTMAFYGRISYSVYLWHFPLAVLSGSRLQNDLMQTAFVLIGATGLAVLSYIFVEAPMQRWLARFRPAEATAPEVRLAA